MNRDPLATCPPEKKANLESMARKSHTSRAYAIRTKCMECAGWNRAEVRRCAIVDCALWPFRCQTGEGLHKIGSSPKLESSDEE